MAQGAHSWSPRQHSWEQVESHRQTFLEELCRAKQAAESQVHSGLGGTQMTGVSC